MRTLLFAALLGCCVSTAALAADKPVSASELKDFQGRYELADGRQLAVTQRGHKLLVQVNDQPAVEVMPAGAATFASGSGKLRIEFDQYPNGSVAGVRVVDGSGTSQLASRR